jgi:hypothetical protein
LKILRPIIFAIAIALLLAACSKPPPNPYFFPAQLHGGAPMPEYELTYSLDEDMVACRVAPTLEPTRDGYTLWAGELVIAHFSVEPDRIWSPELGETVVCEDDGGDTYTYAFQNDLTETGFYETMVWRRGEGLVEYRRGFGAMRDSVELRLAEPPAAS